MSSNQLQELFLLEELKEISELNKRRHILFRKIQDGLKERVALIRTIKDGEKVDAFNGEGEYIGEGVVVGAFLYGISVTNEFELSKYLEHPDRWEKELNNVRYKVYALKKDGTQSQRLLNGTRTFGTNKERFFSYIQPKQLNK